MSRSLKKHPFSGLTTARSEKKDKQAANRLLRRVTHAKTKTGEVEGVLPALREVSDVWKMEKDGKRRFNPVAEPKLVRK